MLYFKLSDRVISSERDLVDVRKIIIMDLLKIETGFSGTDTMTQLELG